MNDMHLLKLLFLHHMVQEMKKLIKLGNTFSEAEAEKWYFKHLYVDFVF